MAVTNRTFLAYCIFQLHLEYLVKSGSKKTAKHVPFSREHAKKKVFSQRYKNSKKNWSRESTRKDGAQCDHQTHRDDNNK